MAEEVYQCLIKVPQELWPDRISQLDPQLKQDLLRLIREKRKYSKGNVVQSDPSKDSCSKKAGKAAIRSSDDTVVNGDPVGSPNTLLGNTSPKRRRIEELSNTSCGSEANTNEPAIFPGSKKNFSTDPIRYSLRRRAIAMPQLRILGVHPLDQIRSIMYTSGDSCSVLEESELVVHQYVNFWLSSLLTRCFSEYYHYQSKQQRPESQNVTATDFQHSVDTSPGTISVAELSQILRQRRLLKKVLEKFLHQLFPNELKRFMRESNFQDSSGNGLGSSDDGVSDDCDAGDEINSHESFFGQQNAAATSCGGDCNGMSPEECNTSTKQRYEVATRRLEQEISLHIFPVDRFTNRLTLRALRTSRLNKFEYTEFARARGRSFRSCRSVFQEWLNASLTLLGAPNEALSVDPTELAYWSPSYVTDDGTTTFERQVSILADHDLSVKGESCSTDASVRIGANGSVAGTIGGARVRKSRQSPIWKSKARVSGKQYAEYVIGDEVATAGTYPGPPSITRRGFPPQLLGVMMFLVADRVASLVELAARIRHLLASRPSEAQDNTANTGEQDSNNTLQLQKFSPWHHPTSGVQLHSYMWSTRNEFETAWTKDYGAKFPALSSLYSTNNDSVAKSSSTPTSVLGGSLDNSSGWPIAPAIYRLAVLLFIEYVDRPLMGLHDQDMHNAVVAVPRGSVGNQLAREPRRNGNGTGPSCVVDRVELEYTIPVSGQQRDAGEQVRQQCVAGSEVKAKPQYGVSGEENTTAKEEIQAKSTLEGPFPETCNPSTTGRHSLTNVVESLPRRRDNNSVKQQIVTTDPSLLATSDPGKKATTVNLEPYVCDLAARAPEPNGLDDCPTRGVPDLSPEAEQFFSETIAVAIRTLPVKLPHLLAAFAYLFCRDTFWELREAPPRVLWKRIQERLEQFKTNEVAYNSFLKNYQKIIQYAVAIHKITALQSLFDSPLENGSRDITEEGNDEHEARDGLVDIPAGGRSK